MDYQPDVWVIVKIESHSDTIYKVLAGWYGGYAGADEWRLNSGIKAYGFDETTGNIEFLGFSQSMYYCNINNEKMSGLTSSIYNNLVESTFTRGGYTVEQISFEDFRKEFSHEL